MDVRLPDMSGFEATRILKSEHTTRNIPVVLTSAYGPFIEGKNVEACGCDGYMPTPIETKKIHRSDSHIYHDWYAENLSGQLASLPGEATQCVCRPGSLSGLRTSGELTRVHRDLHELGEKVENILGYRKEIDHALERIAAIERHIGIERKIAA